MRPWRIALAGLGAAAREIHLPAYERVPGLTIIGGFDPAARSGDFPFPTFSSLEQMLNEARPDILAVATPPLQHFQAVREGLRAGCHIFCEKPFMPTIDEAVASCLLARKAGRRIVVNNQYRFMNIHREAHSRIGTPEFGDLLFVRIEQAFFVTAQTEAGWRGHDLQRTCKEFGIHALDLCRFFFGEDPIAIGARMPRPTGPGGADYLDLIDLHFTSDRSARITLDRLSKGPHRYLTIHLDGTAGYMEARLGGGVQLAAGVRGGTRRPYVDLDVSLGGRTRLYRGESFRTIASDPGDIFAHATSRLMSAFLAALEQDVVPPCDAEDNLRSLVLVFAAYESDAKRTTIEITYPSLDGD